MRRRALLLAGLALPAVARAQGAAPARWVPERTMTLLSGYAPGGSTDITARLLMEPMAAALGPEARFVVDNRPGASGVIATEWLKGRPADGLTVMVQETGAGAVAPIATIGGTRYDPLADFTHLGLISQAPEVLVLGKGFMPGATGPEVIAALRRAPRDGLTYATSGFGGVLHLKTEMLARVLGAQFVHVPYRSGAQMITAIMTGEAQFGLAALASAMPFLRDERVRAVALTGARRFPTLPEVPTLGELGVAGFETTLWYMLWGPAGIPAPAATALNAALVAAQRDPATAERMLGAGHLLPSGPNTPATARAFLEAELAVIRGMVERTGIRLQP